MIDPKKLLLVLAICLASVSAGTVSTSAQAMANPASSPATKAEKYKRTELYFGRSKRSGGEVSESQWQTFLANTVTPEFPDGLTVVEAIGQFRGANGGIVREKSFILILFYPKRRSREMNARIEKIRDAYVKAFDQQSVMRVDLSSTVSVSF